MTRVCVGCGYSGPGAACTICKGANRSSAACTENYCPLCNQPMRARFDWLRFVSVMLCAFGAGILALLVCTLLTGCGPKFTSHADLLNADASTDAAGSAGAAGAPDDAGGSAGDTSIPEPAQGGTAGVSTGAAGSPSTGGAGAASVGGTGAGGAAPCGGLAGSKASAFASFDPPVGGPPSSALDGDPATRWASGEPQAVGQWFRLDLPAGTVLEQLELDAAAADTPAELELELDGAAVASTTSAHGDVLRLVLAKPTPARVLRLLIVTPTTGQWWSIRELRAVCK